MDTRASLLETAKPAVFRHAAGDLPIGQRTLLMGVVNVTPDSFSDGGLYFDAQAAGEYALSLASEGADILDIGAESTRPGSLPISTEEELGRLLPVLEAVASKTTVPISVDTYKASVADIALKSGAVIINDISGFHFDPALPEICARHKAGVILMHIKGTPRDMQRDPTYGDLLGEITAYLKEGIERANEAGIERERILLDPGIGFGKTFDDNYRLIAGLRKLAALGFPLLAGPSRKGFTGEFSKLPPHKRQFATAAAVTLSILCGASLVRVHDVAQMREVASIADRFLRVTSGQWQGNTNRADDPRASR
ncbi:MAG: dihydropteroate synthase [bacterium]